MNESTPFSPQIWIGRVKKNQEQFVIRWNSKLKITKFVLIKTQFQNILYSNLKSSSSITKNFNLKTVVQIQESQFEIEIILFNANLDI